MFEQLIGTFQSVQHDLSSGLKNLSAKAQTVGKSKASDAYDLKHDSLLSLREGLHISAGADLLDRFQSYWTKIHNDIEESASKVTGTDITIRKIERSHERQLGDWNHIQKQLQDIPQLLSDIQHITSNIGKLAADFEEVEASLQELESAIEEQEYCKNEQMQIRELEQYKEQKINEEHILTAQLHDEFNTKLQVKQEEENVVMRERQKAFGEFFVADLDHYKTFGKMERSADVPTPDTPLDELELDWNEQDQQALDDFLGPSENAGPSRLETGGDASQNITMENDEDKESVVTDNNRVKEDENPSQSESPVSEESEEASVEDQGNDAEGANAETSDESEPCKLEKIKEDVELSSDEDRLQNKNNSKVSEEELEDSDDFQDAVDE